MSAQHEIRQTLATMFDQWNREDQKSYMQHYWKSDDLRACGCGDDAHPHDDPDT